jgi:hypothetical protein
LRGEIVVNTQSGESGKGTRDRKTRREGLESDRYPDIIFRPDSVEGAVAAEGQSLLLVRTDHELTVPAEVEMRPDGWSATVHFAIPYVKWGMKNPSTLFLPVSESVEIDLGIGGVLTK